MNSLLRMRRSPTPRTKAAAAAAAALDQTGPTTSPAATAEEQLSIPSNFRCPISLDLMKDPVTTPTGITYDRASIEAWMDAGHDSCPVTNMRIHAAGSADLIPNHAIRRMIQDWCVANRALGVERIPTPRIPVTRTQVAEMVKEVDDAATRADAGRCVELARKIRERAKESERNRRCIASGGAAARALAGAFEAFARKQTFQADQLAGITTLLEEILAALVLTFSSADQYQLQVDDPTTAANNSATLASLSTPSSLRSLASIMTHGDFAARHNAVLAVKELVHPTNNRSSSPPAIYTTSVIETNGIASALISLIKNPISQRITKSTLVAAYHMVMPISDTPNSNNNTSTAAAERFVALGAVPILIESLADSDRSTCEKALGLLDRLCDCPSGRDAAYAHALTVPVLVKKLLRVSDVATCLAVSLLWKLCAEYKHNKDRLGRAGQCLQDAMQVGAFQKLLIVLQMGCAASTKDKVTHLLKLMNTCRGTNDCIESVDFRGLKRPF